MLHLALSSLSSTVSPCSSSSMDIDLLVVGPKLVFASCYKPVGETPQNDSIVSLPLMRITHHKISLVRIIVNFL